MFKGFETMPEVTAAAPILGVFVWRRNPSFTHPRSPLMLSQVSRLNPQACGLLLEAGQPASPGSSTVGKSTLAKPPQFSTKLRVVSHPRLGKSSSCPRRAAQDIPVMKFPFLVALGIHGKSEILNSCSPLGVGWDSP